MKIIKLLATIVAGVGLFLPMLTVTILKTSETVSFFEASVEGKIMVGAAAVVVLLSLIQFKSNSLGTKVINLILIEGCLIMYILYTISYIDLSKYLKEYIKPGYGFFMSIIGFGIAFLFEIINIFADNEKTYSEEIDFSSLSAGSKGIPQAGMANPGITNPQVGAPNGQIGINQYATQAASNEPIVNNQSAMPPVGMEQQPAAAPTPSITNIQDDSFQQMVLNSNINPTQTIQQAISQSVSQDGTNNTDTLN